MSEATNGFRGPIGPFEVLDSLGQGAGSTILKIRREADKKIYALKLIAIHDADDRKYLQQAEHEFEIGRQLDHPHLLKVYQLEHTRKFLRVNGARLLIEYIEGRPLSLCAKLPLGKLLHVFIRAADGLAYMHRQGFFHADIKPDNIMVTANTVKVIDYGLAWRQGESKNRVQGTLEYLAPEQAQAKVVNARTDIFNFGATMYRVLAGAAVPPQLREPVVEGYEATLDDLVRPVRLTNDKVPTVWDDLVRQCLRVDPKARPSSMREVRDRLRALTQRS